MSTEVCDPKYRQQNDIKNPTTIQKTEMKTMHKTILTNRQSPLIKQAQLSPTLAGNTTDEQTGRTKVHRQQITQQQKTERKQHRLSCQQGLFVTDHVIVMCHPHRLGSAKEAAKQGKKQQPLSSALLLAETNLAIRKPSLQTQ